MAETEMVFGEVADYIQKLTSFGSGLNGRVQKETNGQTRPMFVGK